MGFSVANIYYERETCLALLVKYELPVTSFFASHFEDFEEGQKQTSSKLRFVNVVLRKVSIYL